MVTRAKKRSGPPGKALDVVRAMLDEEQAENVRLRIALRKWENLSGLRIYKKALETSGARRCELGRLLEEALQAADAMREELERLKSELASYGETEELFGELPLHVCKSEENARLKSELAQYRHPLVAAGKAQGAAEVLAENTRLTGELAVERDEARAQQGRLDASFAREAALADEARRIAKELAQAPQWGEDSKARVAAVTAENTRLLEQLHIRDGQLGTANGEREAARAENTRLKEEKRQDDMDRFHTARVEEENTRLVGWCQRASKLLSEAWTQFETEAQNYEDMGPGGVRQYQPHGKALVSLASRLHRLADEAPASDKTAIRQPDEGRSESMWQCACGQWTDPDRCYRCGAPRAIRQPGPVVPGQAGKACGLHPGAGALPGPGTAAPGGADGAG